MGDVSNGILKKNELQNFFYETSERILEETSVKISRQNL